MREEEVTMILVKCLKKRGWKILSFDYPGSGTGFRLHKNGTNYKNKDTIVPDIIAVKGGEALFFENKDHFCKRDFEKQYNNIVVNSYSDDVDTLLRPYMITKCRWGIGIPDDKYKKGAIDNLWMVDFLYTVVDENNIIIKK